MNTNKILENPGEAAGLVEEVDENLQSLANDLKNKVSRTLRKYEQRARKSPEKTMLLALVTGYCLHRLPVRALLVLQARTIVALAPPVLLALGAVKLCGIVRGLRRELASSARTFGHEGEFGEGV